jgi:hypothetical protein
MYRDGDFIKDDNDIDLAVFAGDLEEINKYVKDLENILQIKKLNFGKLLGSVRIYAKYIIDLIVLYKYENKYYFIKGYDEETKEYLAKEFDEKYFDNQMNLIYDNKCYKVPLDIEEYLTHLYGNWREKKPAGTSNLVDLVRVNFEKKLLEDR